MGAKRTDINNISEQDIGLLKGIMAQPKFSEGMVIVQDGIEVNLIDILSKVIKKKAITNKEISQIRESSLLENLEKYKATSQARNDIISVLLIDKVKELIDSLPTNVLPGLTHPDISKVQEKSIDINIKAPIFLKSLEDQGRIFSDAINFGDNGIGEGLVIGYFKDAFGLYNLPQVRKKIESFGIPGVKVGDRQESFRWISIIERLYTQTRKPRPKKSITETMQITVAEFDDKLIGENLSLKEFLKVQDYRPEDVSQHTELLGRLFRTGNGYDLYTIGTYNGTADHLLNVFIKQEPFKTPPKIGTINKLLITEKKYYEKPKDPKHPYNITAEIL